MAKKPAQKAKQAKPKSNKMLQVLVWVLAPLIAYIGHPTLIVALAGMIPTFVAYIIDTRPQRYAARTVGYMNFAGVTIVAAEMWGSDNTWHRALDLISQPTNWLIMFGCAAVGWVFYYAAPPIVYAYLSVANELKSKQLQKEQKDLVKEWGDDVTTAAPDLDADGEAIPKQIEDAVAKDDSAADETDSDDEKQSTDSNQSAAAQ